MIMIKPLFRTLILPMVILCAAVMLAPLPTLAQASGPDSYCYMQREDGSLVDLGGLCTETSVPAYIPSQSGSQTSTSGTSSAISTQPGQPLGSQQVTYPTPPQVYDYDQMAAFDNELYGE